MTVQLNSANGGCPAAVDMFSDAGSVWHLGLGMLAGSDLVTPSEKVMLFAAFTGYQVSQAESGETWCRIGGEFIEFALGMLLGTQAKGLWRTAA